MKYFIQKNKEREKLEFVPNMLKFFTLQKEKNKIKIPPRSTPLKNANENFSQ